MTNIITAKSKAKNEILNITAWRISNRKINTEWHKILRKILTKGGSRDCLWKTNADFLLTSVRGDIEWQPQEESESQLLLVPPEESLLRSKLLPLASWIKTVTVSYWNFFSFHFSDLLIDIKYDKIFSEIGYHLPMISSTCLVHVSHSKAATYPQWLDTRSDKSFRCHGWWRHQKFLNYFLHFQDFITFFIMHFNHCYIWYLKLLTTGNWTKKAIFRIVIESKRVKVVNVAVQEVD